MRWYRTNRQTISQYIISVLGYILFVCVAFFSFRRLVAQRVGMDSLIAFLLSQTLGMVVLHFMRRTIRYVLKRRVSSHQYGVFLMVNAVVILVNAFVMYVMDLMSDYNEMSLQLFSTGIMLCVNIIMQMLHSKSLQMEELEQ